MSQPPIDPGSSNAEEAVALPASGSSATPIAAASAPPAEPSTGPVAQRASTVSTQAGPATQEIRFAAAMTGGVSLAIWMGGVARELNLLDQASRLREVDNLPHALAEDVPVRDLYRKLLNLLDQTVRIDVLSGTSAGGLNASVLGLCHARGLDLAPLRDMWLTTGAFDSLLRDPAEKEPPSLLQGDGVLLKGLCTGIEALVNQKPSNAAGQRDTTVFVTTTLLEGETSRFTDAYGTLIPNVDHHGLFTFLPTFFDKLDGNNKNSQVALAVAARCSASFPGAFEPGFVPCNDQAQAAAEPQLRPPMADYANTTRPHWVADGGLLANRPIGPLLQAVFDQPADERQVRRVLLYVVPDPGGTPDPRSPAPEETMDKPLGMIEALTKDLRATFNQSIAGDLAAIRSHNDRVDSIRNTRLRLAEIGIALRGAPLATSASWADYLAKESDWLVLPVIDALMRRLTTLPDLSPWESELAQSKSLEQGCREAAAKAVRDGWSPAAQAIRDDWGQPEPAGGYEGIAKLGRSPYDAAKSVVLTLIRNAFMLATESSQREGLATLGKAVHDAFTPGGSFQLGPEMDKELSNPTTGRDLSKIAATIAQNYLSDRAKGEQTTLAQAWQTLAELIDNNSGTLGSFVLSADAHPADREPADTVDQRRRQASAELQTLLTYLGNTPYTVALRLLNLHVAERAMLPIGVEIDQPVELIQVSANTRTLLNLGCSTAANKLTGDQLHHFGAFYKGSWRANDWMWGRLDGAGWLVHILLDPRRIATKVEADNVRYPAGRRAETFVDDLKSIVGNDPPGCLIGQNADGTPLALTHQAVCDELQFLDRPDVPMPACVPLTAMWVASAYQYQIASVELPIVAEEMLKNPGPNDGQWALNVMRDSGTALQATVAAKAAMAAIGAGRSTRPARQQLTQATQGQQEGKAQLDPPDADTVAGWLTNCPVPTQKLDCEIRAPLFTRTVAKAAAVGTAAASASFPNPPRAVSSVLATARTVTLTAYRAVDLARGRPRQLIVGGGAIAVVGVVLALRHTVWLGFTGIIVLLVGLWVISLGAWGKIRRALPAIAAAAVIVAVAALCAPVTRDKLLGVNGDPKQPGWVTDSAVPFLRDRWWGLLTVLGGLLILSAAWTYVLRILSGRKQSTVAKSTKPAQRGDATPG